MSMILYLNTDTSYMELENINDLKIVQTYNEHGILKLTALLQEEAKVKYATEIQPYEMVEIVIGESESYKTLFKGILKEIKIHQIKNVYYMFVTAATGSYKMDLELKSRSFQNRDTTYNEILNLMVEEYPGGDIADYLTNEKKLENLLVQYKETDWEFFRRIASKFSAGILPSLLSDAPKIIFGKSPGTDRGEITKYNFKVKKDIEKYMMLSKNGNKAVTELDVVSFEIETTDEFYIGDRLTYYDKASNYTYTNFYVNRKEIEMIGGILRFKYLICPENGFMTGRIYNENIVGVSLKGEVIERISDCVKVKLEIDDEQDINTAWQFKYTTPYAAGESGGWYVMPEVGDTVLIYFPDKEEEHALGLNSVRLKNTGNDKIGNPEIKYLRTKDGKEIKLAPDELTITCSNWINKETGEKNKIYIQLNDVGGVTIESTKPVYITSDEDINITADKNIMIAAEDEIKFKCKSSMLKMNSKIEAVSANVKVN